VHLTSTQVFDRHSKFQGRLLTLRKVFTSVPQQPFNFRWNLSTAKRGLLQIRMLLADGGFNRWMQRFVEIARPVCRSLVFSGDVR
jgi:hypothetical protein